MTVVAEASPVSVESEVERRAFNQGADARLAGWPLSANPYLVGNPCRSTWRRGWQDVDQHWGEGVKGRWPGCPLPPVRE